MLEQILDYIHNYFEKKICRGYFVISNGQLDVDFLQEDQYFRIVGSVFNDGVHQHPDTGLKDEAFVGEIWAMAVPPAVIALADEIDEWVKTNNASTSPFVSESFAGYSYTKATDQNSLPVSWQSMFRSRLNQWRKIA